VNTNQTQPIDAPVARKRRRPWKVIVPVIVVTALLALVLLLNSGGSGDEAEAAALYPVRRGPLTISIAERGTINNRDKVVVKCKVRGRTSIIWIIEEGKLVTKGDLLLELDSSEFVERKATQEITVSNAEANFKRARENLAVARNQAESDNAQAELDLRFAKLDLQKYVQGEYPQELQSAQNDITIAKEELTRAEDKLAGSERLATEGYLSRTELEADRLAARRKQLDLELTESKLTVLTDFTHTRQMQKLESDVQQAELALERTRRKASADILRAEVDLNAKETEYKREKDQLEDLLEQIANCTINAPVDGLVVYATTSSRHWWRNQEPLAEGREVREREELFHLPTAKAMMSEIKIHESSLERISVGMPVRITVSALPGREFSGKVARISPMPDAQSAWMNPDLKVFNTQIDLDGENGELRPGMSCETEIVVEQHEDVLFVPLQTVQQVKGEPTVFVQGPDGIEERQIKIGLDNDRSVHVLEGLAEGDQVLLAPPMEPSAVEEGMGDTFQFPTKQSLATSQPAKEAEVADGKATTRPAKASERREVAQGDVDTGAAKKKETTER
jgi:HlyD family secretion protein